MEMFGYYNPQLQHHQRNQNLTNGSRKRKAGDDLHPAVTTDVEIREQADNGDKEMAKQKRLWVKYRPNSWWERFNSPEFPEEEFKKEFRMGKATFEMICRELWTEIERNCTRRKDVVPVRKRVAVCIWRLATGERLSVVSEKFGLGTSTCHKLVLEVCRAIKKVLKPKYWPDGQAELRKNQYEFELLSGIPYVVGSMHTTHIEIIAPKNSSHEYIYERDPNTNEATLHSMAVQGVFNPKGLFTDIFIAGGSMYDDQVLAKSKIFKQANQGELKGVWIGGGAGHPLLDWLMVPYTHEKLNWAQYEFNLKLEKVQNVAKEAFAKLKGRWCFLQERSDVKSPKDLKKMVKACCVLHNVCEWRNEEMDPQLNFNPVILKMPLRTSDARKARDFIARKLLHAPSSTPFLS